jgi:hypothetical protein
MWRSRAKNLPTDSIVKQPIPSLPATNAKRLRKGANGSRECAPDDRLRDEAIHRATKKKKVSGIASLRSQ